MAGEIVLTFAVEELLKKVSSIGIDGIVRAWGLKKDLEKLMESTRRIQAVLQDADKQATNERVKTWLLKLQDVAYTADDVLDEFSYETLRRRIEIQNQLKRKVCDFVSRSNPILFRLNMSQKVKKINESLADIEKEATRELALRGVAGVDHRQVAPTTPLDRETVSFLNKSEPLVGRTSDVEAIIKMLQENSSNAPPLTVVSIVGIGGLGKTTLAKLVLEEAKKKNIFSETVWVCVSDNFDVKVILGKMLEILSRSSTGLTAVEAIVTDLRDKLKNKRLLLVLDDAWNKESKKWESLKGHLLTICCGNGNFVVVTTRSRVVANTMETSPQHILELKQLSDEECWSIIQGKVLLRRDEPMFLELEKIGIDIAKKCKGVPLVAQVLGGTLGSKRSTEEWLSIRNSDVWKSMGEDNEVLPVLKLSFDKLDPSLKPCFTYCSLLPKDYTFDKGQLVQLWMAEGFLYSASTNGGTRADKSMEDIGDNYLNNLLSVCLLQDVEDKRGNYTQCKMHDLLHDLALSVSGTKIPELDNDSLKTFDGRRLSFVVDSRRRSIEELVRDHVQGNERSLFSNVDVLHKKCANFKSLRTVNMSEATLKELPTSIGKLKHLRFLDLSRNDRIKELPESIGKLYNLQTLRLLGCRDLSKFPRTIRNLVNLRHISLGHWKCEIMPTLGHLPSLKILEIEAMLNVRRIGSEFYGESKGNVKLFSMLLKFKLSFMNSLEEWEAPDEQRSLAFQSLQELVIDECRLLKSIPLSHLFSLKIMKIFWCPELISLPIGLTSLEDLRIFHCAELESISSSQDLVSLKRISLSYCPKLTSLSIVSASLEDLRIERCAELESISSSQDLVSLNRFFLSDCPKLTSLPIVSASLEDLRIFDCEELESISSSQDLVSLNFMEIHSCGKLTSLPKGFVSLKELRIKYCHNLEIISSLQNLVSLNFMEIEDCPKLTSLPKGLVSLKEIRIKYCGNLESISGLQNLVSLNVMEIASCRNLTLFSTESKLLKHLKINSISNFSADAFSGLSSLESLRIRNMGFIPSVELLTSLQTLELAYCEDLASLLVGLQLFNCLQVLVIYGCRDLTALPPEIKSCTSLKRLEVTHCYWLISIETDIISSLTQLEELNLGPFSHELVEFPGFDKTHPVNNPFLKRLNLYGYWELQVKSLPYLGHLTALKELTIREFGISELPIWVGQLSSLEILTIWDCESLISLPPTMKQLSKLTEFYIRGSPLLEQKLEEDRSAIWPNISHIERFKLDGRVDKKPSNRVEEVDMHWFYNLRIPGENLLNSVADVNRTRYAISFAGNFLETLYVQRSPKSNKTLHVVSSAFKATLTWHNMRTLQECLKPVEDRA